MVIYQFNCFCEDSFVGMTLRQFDKLIKEHNPKSIVEFCKMINKENKCKRVVNFWKISAIAEYLVNNPDCASNYS